MCEETVRDPDAEIKQRKRVGSRSPRRRSLSPPPHPGAKPITSGLYLEPHHLVGRLYRLHHIFQIPMYFVKWVMSQLWAMYAVIFWRTPVDDDDVVRLFEETSIIFTLRRDHEAEKEAFKALKGCTAEKAEPLLETRHYYIDVKRCELELLIREPGTTYKSGIGQSIYLKSWSARYTKTRRREGYGGGHPGRKARDGEGTKDGKWTNRILSFVVNGQTIQEREKMFAFLHHYQTTSSHTKCHLMGNSLADRILLDDRVRDKLSESTWTTTALHYGLLYGTKGPLTYPSRNAKNAWMGLGCLPTWDSFLKETENMSALGADHADKERWAELELPFSSYLLDARHVLTRQVNKNEIPPDLQEAIFLSCIFHATDHILGCRACWGKVFSFNPKGKPGNWYDHYESVVWRMMWAEPTLNPIWNNRIRGIRKPFYRQLYKGLKEIDTFKVADEITASIMY
ncbi:unnamed protein product [Ascophyllum nodosum]